MKKEIYEIPASKVVKLNYKQNLLSGSPDPTGETGGGGGTGFAPEFNPDED